LFVGISAFFIWYAALYFAQLIVGALVGQWLMGRTQETWPLIGRMAVGIVIVRLATVVPIIGGWVKFGRDAVGFGGNFVGTLQSLPTNADRQCAFGTVHAASAAANTTVGGCSRRKNRATSKK